VDFLKNGHGLIYDLQARPGHASVKTTEKYLQYPTPEEAQTAKFGRLVGRGNSTAGIRDLNALPLAVALPQSLYRDRIARGAGRFRGQVKSRSS
jgi:hypothetical protein